MILKDILKELKMKKTNKWTECKLGDILEIKYGKDHKSLSEGTIPAYGSGGIMRYVDKAIYNDESILIPRKGTLNNITYKNEPFWTVDTMFYTKINKTKVFTKFLFYQLTKIDYNNLNVGSAVPSLTVQVLSDIEIFLPTLTEQIQIASILSSLDEKIDLLHRQNKTLEQLAGTLFRQWFVEKLEDSWEVKTISDIIDVRDGTHDSPKQTITGKYLITSKHLKPKGIDFKSAYKISEEDFNEVNKRSKVDKGDILFSMIGTLGLIHIVDNEPDFVIKNIGLFKCSQKPEFTNFLYLLLNGPSGIRFVHENAIGSTQEYITLGSLRNFEFIYPGEKTIKEFDLVVKPFFRKIKSNIDQIQILTQLRDALLPKLINREVRIE